jgi:hypothetical protein
LPKIRGTWVRTIPGRCPAAGARLGERIDPTRTSGRITALLAGIGRVIDRLLHRGEEPSRIVEPEQVPVLREELGGRISRCFAPRVAAVSFTPGGRPFPARGAGSGDGGPPRAR